jgi:hypothetical protein
MFTGKDVCPFYCNFSKIDVKKKYMNMPPFIILNNNNSEVKMEVEHNTQHLLCSHIHDQSECSG